MNSHTNYKGFDVDVVVNGGADGYIAEVMITPENCKGTAGCSRILKFEVFPSQPSAFEAISIATDTAHKDIDNWFVDVTI